MRTGVKTLCMFLLLGAYLLVPLSGVADTLGEVPEAAALRMQRINSIVSEREAQRSEAREGVATTAAPVVEGGSGLVVRMLEGLVLCAGLFFIGVGVYRRLGGERAMPRGRRMRVVERMMVAPKTSLVLANVDGREVLLAVGEKVSLVNLGSGESGVEEMERLCRDVEDQQQHSV